MEIWNLVDENMVETGLQFERNFEVPIPSGSYYRVVEVWTLTPDGKVLLTQRHPDKFLGLMWESTGGAVVGSEDIALSAKRELLEETGIDCSLDDLKFIEVTKYTNNFVNSFYHVYHGDTSALTMQDGETVDYKFIEFDKIEEMKEYIPQVIYDRLQRYLPVFMSL